MPLPKPLPDLVKDLRELLIEDLAATLQAMKELLPENGDKNSQVLALQARLKDANKERIRNTISSEDYQRRVDTIRAECLDMINALVEADFEAETGEGTGPAARTGSVLYRVPHRMPLQKPTICTVRVAMDEDAILEDIVLDDDVKLRPKVEVSDMMKAELIDPEGEVFAVRALSEIEQLVRPHGYTQWLFSVTPKVEGQHQLLVKVSMLEFNPKLNKYVPREVSILETVTIVTGAEQSEVPETPLKASGEKVTLAPQPGSGESASPNPASPVPPPMPDIVIKKVEDNTPPLPSHEMVIEKTEAPPEPSEGSSSRKGLRAVAFFLAFLVFGTSATWAFTPPPTRDWWMASLRDTPEAYQEYIDNYDRDASNSYLEAAYFRRAEISGALHDWRAYQQRFTSGKYENEVNERVKILEEKAWNYLRDDPSVGTVRQYLRDYYDGERLDQVRQMADSRAELRSELQADLEAAYLRNVQEHPTARKITDYLSAFPQSDHLGEITELAARQPGLMKEVQPAIEQTILERARTAAQPDQLEQLLPAIQRMEGSELAAKVSEIVADKGKMKKSVWQQLQTLIEEKKQETAETNGDKDGDGVPDANDQCPELKGEASNKGCPTEQKAGTNRKRRF